VQGTEFLRQFDLSDKSAGIVMELENNTEEMHLQKPLWIMNLYGQRSPVFFK
jgi:hypothetical protein